MYCRHGMLVESCEICSPTIAEIVAPEREVIANLHIQLAAAQAVWKAFEEQKARAEQAEAALAAARRDREWLVSVICGDRCTSAGPTDACGDCRYRAALRGKED